MEERKRWDIIGSYGKILENRKTPISLETDLPFSKALIRIVILEDLLYQTDLKLQDHLKVAFTELESFLPNEEFEILNGFNKTLLNRNIDSIIDDRDQSLKALEIQMRLLEKQKTRQEQLNLFLALIEHFKGEI